MRTRSLNLIGGCLIMSGSLVLACASAISTDNGGAGGSSASTPGGAVAGGGSSNPGGKGGSTGTGGSTSNPGKGGNIENKGGHNEGGAGSVVSGGGGSGGKVTGAGGKGQAGGGESTGGRTGRGDAGTGGSSGAGDKGTGGRSGKGGSSDGGSPSAGGSIGTGGSNTDGGSTGGDPAKSAGCGKTPSLKSGDGQTISVSGSDRKYNLKVPDNYDNNHPYRLIVSYHWLSGKADDVSKGGVAKPYYGLWDLAGGSTIFVAPDGLNNAWNNTNGVDVEFSRQLITKLEDEFCIDKSRIFCEGFSMGGSMSYAMACAAPDMIRGVLVHSGGTMSGCVKHDKPVAYFMTHGTKDSVCKYPSFPMPPLQDFAKLNGCKKPDPTLGAEAFEQLLPEPTSTASACVEFEGCKEGYPVRSCLFVGDHTPSPDGTNGWVPKESWKFITQF